MDLYVGWWLGVWVGWLDGWTAWILLIGWIVWVGLHRFYLIGLHRIGFVWFEFCWMGGLTVWMGLYLIGFGFGPPLTTVASALAVSRAAPA